MRSNRRQMVTDAEGEALLFIAVPQVAPYRESFGRGVLLPFRGEHRG